MISSQARNLETEDEEGERGSGAPQGRAAADQ